MKQTANIYPAYFYLLDNKQTIEIMEENVGNTVGVRGSPLSISCKHHLSFILKASPVITQHLVTLGASY